MFYDRSDLIGKAVFTVQEVLVEAVVLVVILLILFLGNLRAALVVSLILPLATLITFGVLRTLAIPPISCRSAGSRSRSACWSTAPSSWSRTSSIGWRMPARPTSRRA